MILTQTAAFLIASGLVVRALSNVPLHLNQGFWFGEFTIGPQNFSLTVDTGSFAILIGEGKYLPSATSQQTNLSEFIEFNGASEDGTATASETIFFVRDDVSFAGVQVTDFLVGNITVGDPLLGDGIAGFSPPSSASDPFDPTFSSGQGLIETFCADGTVSPCQFGLVLGTNGNGTFMFGEMDKSQINGSVTTLPTSPNDSWTVQNSTVEDSPVLVVDGNSIGHIFATFDCGTPNVIGPLDQVRAVLQAVGYNLTEQNLDGGITVTLGTYDCSREPARFGFSFPPSNTVHYVDLGANVLNRTADGQICTANILGTSITDQWQIGQTWFQGRYVQHDLDNNLISFADLE